MTVAAFVLEPGRLRETLLSQIRSPPKPRTRSAGSTTLRLSDPMWQVPTGWYELRQRVWMKSRNASALARDTVTPGHNLEGHGAGWPVERVIGACASHGLGGIVFWPAYDGPCEVEVFPRDT